MYSYGPPGGQAPVPPGAGGQRPGAPGPGAPGAGGPPGQKRPPLAITPSRQFSSWLKDQNASFAFTTYQAGKIFLVGTGENGRMAFFERTFARVMGLHATPQTIWLSSLYQIWRLENSLPAGETHKGHDRVYVPQVGYTTGDIDVHDLGVDKSGKPVFINTLFGCIATVSDTHSFRPLWKPPWLSRLAAEDRSHLNGLAMENGEPAYVTSASTADIVDAWRDHRKDGGVVCDVRTNEIVARGLSMPHSPRLHNGQLWLLEAGSGYLGRVDLDTGKFERLCFCPGFARGLTFINGFAIVGTSAMREDRTFGGLELGDNLKKHGIEARCSLLVIDLKTGDLVHWIRIEGAVRELFDVSIIPGVRRPMALGFVSDEIRRALTVEASKDF